VLTRVAALSSSPLRCLSHHLFSFEIQKLKFADATGFLGEENQTRRMDGGDRKELLATNAGSLPLECAPGFSQAAQTRSAAEGGVCVCWDGAITLRLAERIVVRQRSPA
jgi:hypothetical protein